MQVSIGNKKKLFNAMKKKKKTMSYSQESPRSEKPNQVKFKVYPSYTAMRNIYFEEALMNSPKKL